MTDRQLLVGCATTIVRLEGRMGVVENALAPSRLKDPSARGVLDRLDHVAGELPVLEHVFVWSSGAPHGPDPAVPFEPFAVLDDAPDTDPGVLAAVTDFVHEATSR